MNKICYKNFKYYSCINLILNFTVMTALNHTYQQQINRTSKQMMWAISYMLTSQTLMHLVE